MPDRAARLEILKVHTQDRPLGTDVDLVELAGGTEGLVGSDLAFICKRATILAIGDAIHVPKEPRKTGLAVSKAHFQAAINEVQRKRTT